MLAGRDDGFFSPVLASIPPLPLPDCLGSSWLGRNSSPCRLMLEGGRSPNLWKLDRSQSIRMDAVKFTLGMALLFRIQVPGGAWQCVHTASTWV